MSNEIKIDATSIDRAFTDLHASIEALETSFAREIEGQNKLEMVSSFNEIKKEYDALLTQFRMLFLTNVQAADKSIKTLQETERKVAQNIRLLK